MTVVALFAIRHLWVPENRDAAARHETASAASSFQRCGAGHATEDTGPDRSTGTRSSHNPYSTAVIRGSD